MGKGWGGREILPKNLGFLLDIAQLQPLWKGTPPAASCLPSQQLAVSVTLYNLLKKGSSPNENVLLDGASPKAVSGPARLCCQDKFNSLLGLNLKFLISYFNCV